MQGLELKQSLTTTLHLTLMVTIHSVCRRSVTTTDYDPSQDYPLPHDQITRKHCTHWFKPFIVKSEWFSLVVPLKGWKTVAKTPREREYREVLYNLYCSQNMRNEN